MEILAPVLENLLKFLGVIAPILFGLYKYKTDRKDKKQKIEIETLTQEKTAHKFNSGALYSLLKLKMYSKLEDIYTKLTRRTKVMRFIVFVAINGKTHPKRVYALYGEKEGNKGIDKNFKSIEIDSHYRDTLIELERDGSKLIKVISMPSGMIKNIYFSEEISFSYLKFIKRFNINENDDAIVYSSFATQSDDGFTDIELTSIDLLVTSELKPLINKIVKE